MRDARILAWRLHPQTRLRRTRDGGAAFLPETATTVELDTEAFAALAALATPQTARELRCRLIGQFCRNFTVAEVDILLRDLAAPGFIMESHDEMAGHPIPPPALCDPPSFAPAPESVHLQLNNVCNLRCPSCYVGLQEEDWGSLPLERIFALIDEWAEMGVFQLALGGGEPLISPKFVPTVCRARQHGIVPNVTTNGWVLTEGLLDEIVSCIGEVRLSLNDAVSVNTQVLEEKAALARARGVRFGFNLIITRRNLDCLADLLGWACAQGAATINLIRPKPAPGNAPWYAQNALAPADSHRLLGLLGELEPICIGTTLTVDCAFSFLFYGRSAEELKARGVAGCAMGDRFATVRWNGDVYPCSHLRGEGFKAGSVRTESFRDIWERSAVFTDVRRELGQVEGHCGGCSHNAFCKGCRAVMRQAMGNWLAADHECGVNSGQAGFAASRLNMSVSLPPGVKS